jgi:hypothetical protein
LVNNLPSSRGPGTLESQWGASVFGFFIGASLRPERLFSLTPVTFCYKEQIDPVGIPQFGLVAEKVEKVNPDLIVRDKEGKPYSVRYDQVNAMLLNEFLEERQTVQELKKEVAALTAGLQKVSAQLEMSKPAGQTVLNNR